MSGFAFPPPASGSQGPAVEVDYPRPAPGGGFIFPPPRVTDSGEDLEVARLFGQQLSQWGDLSEWSAVSVSNLGVVVEDYGNVLERKVEPWAVPTIAGLYETINRRADPTIPLSAMMSPASTTTPALAAGWTGSDRTYMAFITPAINRAYEQIHFMVGEVTSPPAEMHLAIFVVDAARQVHRQLGNVRLDGLPLGRTWVTYEFDRWVGTQGSYIGIAIHQAATGNRRPLLGLQDTPRPLPNNIFPRKITASRITTGPIPAVIDGETELDFQADWFVPYIELSEGIGIELRSFGDLWTTVGETTRPWVALTSTGVNSGGGYVNAMGFGYRVSLYDTPLSTDRVRVRSSINRIWSNNFRRSTLVFRASNDMLSGVGLSAINPDGGNGRYELIQWSGVAVAANWDTRTVVATIPLVPQVGDVIEIDYLQGLVTVRLNGQTVVAEQPVAGPSGAAGRFVGLQLERTRSFTGAAFPSPWFGPWTARDLPAESGGDGDGGTGDEDETGGN